MKTTNMDMAKVIATALFNLPELVTEKNSEAWKKAKSLARSKKEDLASYYEKAKKVLEDRLISHSGPSPAEEGEKAARQEAYDIEEDQIEDALVPKYAIQPLRTALIVKFAKGELDMKKLAREELRSRGLNINGTWIGFDAAEREKP